LPFPQPLAGAGSGNFLTRRIRESGDRRMLSPTFPYPVQGRARDARPSFSPQGDASARSPQAVSVICELAMQRRGGLLLRNKISQQERADVSV
jgi:hypothetical protein